MASPPELNSKSPLLSLPWSIRRRIFYLVSEGPDSTGLLNTSRQARREMEYICVPPTLTKLQTLFIQIFPHYDPLGWLWVDISWHDENKHGHHKRFGITSLDDPLVTRLLKQVQWIRHYATIMVHKPKNDDDHLAAFLLLFAKMQDAATLLARLPGGHIFRTVMTRLNWAARWSHHEHDPQIPFWDTRLHLPPTCDEHVPKFSQGLCLYEYMVLHIAEIKGFEAVEGGVMFDDLDYHYATPWASSFQVNDSYGRTHSPGYEVLFELICHQVQCHHCRRGRPRSKECVQRWKQQQGMSKAYVRVRNRVNAFAHALPRLIDAMCEQGGDLGGPFENLCRQKDVARTSSSMNFLSPRNRRHNRDLVSDKEQHARELQSRNNAKPKRSQQPWWDR